MTAARLRWSRDGQVWLMESVLNEMTITQQGARYALARFRDSYVVVDTVAIGTPVVAEFPLSPQGWFAARRQLETLERPPTTPTFNSTRAAPAATSMMVRVGVILVGVAVGAVGLFPSYLSGSSLASQGSQLLPHLVYLVGWAVAGVLLLNARFSQVSAIAAVGLSAMSFGFFVTDIGSAASSAGQSGGAGLYLSLVGWAICTGGSLAALLVSRGGSTNDSLSWRDRLVLPGLVVLIGAVVTFALPWDSYRLVAAATGQSESFSAGNAFSNPGAVIIGELIIMAAMVILLGLAFVWRPIVTGAALFVGALIPLVAQLFSALLQPAPALSAFGISPALAVQDQVHLSAGYTPWFYLYCGAIGLLVVAGGWMVQRATSPKS